jgi:5-methylcytosine-specific restriction endonuclease McrA
MPIGDSIYLPLYSERKGVLYVPPKSGLNNGRAAGRQRNPKETYIPIPAWIHRAFPGFFPQRSISFHLVTADPKKRMKAKVCQDGGKALMSDPNHELLDEVFLRLDVKGRPVTIEDLYLAGFDSVKLTRVSPAPLAYRMELAPVDSFEKFKYTFDSKRGRAARMKPGSKVYSYTELLHLTSQGSFGSNNNTPRGTDKPESRVVARTEFARSAAIIAAALNRSKGVCDLCHAIGPFRCADGRPFLEVHHIVPLSEGGSDTLENVAAVCPNCHRACHFASDKMNLTGRLKSRLRG